MRLNKGLIVFMLLITACTGTPTVTPVGFTTSINVGRDGRLLMTERHYAFFTDQLQSDPSFHFSGKLIYAFDTIFTSTLQRSIGNDPLVMLTSDSTNYVLDTSSTDFHSVFYRRDKWFIYRTFVPEPSHRQTVVLDVAAKDSALIASYFYSSKMNTFISR
jgi:hypothetical protein